MWIWCCFKAYSYCNNKSEIIGIDYDEFKLDQAMLNNNYENLTFMNLDATKTIPDGNWEYILSNVLEHISSRTLFIKKIIKNSKCIKF